MYKLTIRGWLLSSVFSLITGLVMGQYNNIPTLHIGDPAPAIKVIGWARGNPVAGFEKGNVYVVDFWATWCGGCIASFPHISAVAEKYKGEVHFFSVDSYEEIGENKGKDMLPVVKEFLKKPQGQRLTLDVAIDGPGNEMFTTWIKPLRRQGFPTTFVIDQDGRIAWIDVNLDNLDWVLSEVLAKRWDNKKAASIMQQKDAIEDLLFATFRNKEGDKTKEYRAIMQASDRFETQFPDRKDAVAFYKFMALSELDISKVPPLLEQMAADPRSTYINLNDAAGLTLRKKNMPPGMYEAIAKVQERLLLNEHNGTGHGGKTIALYESLAATYNMAGNVTKAVSSMEKALALGRLQNAPPDQIQKLQTDLDKYKAGTAGKS